MTALSRPKLPIGRRTRRRAARLHCEALEGRQLLAVVSWATDASGSWTDPTKWSTGTVPAAGDDVVIDRPGANPTVTLTGVGETAYHTVNIKDTLELSAGKLITTADSSISGRLILDGGDVQVNSGTLTLSGTTDWTSGLFGGVAAKNTGTMTVSGTTPHTVGGGGTLSNSGTIDLVGSASIGLGDSYGSGTIDNLAGGLVDLQGDGSIVNNGGGGTFKDAGTLRKSSGTSSTLNGVSVSLLGGTVDVRSGSLSLPVGGTSTGATFIVASGSAVHLGGRSTMTGTYSGSGSGTVSLDLGDGADGLNAQGATFDFPAGMLSWTQGTIYNTLTNTGTIALTGTSPKTLGGGTTLVDTGTIDVTGSGPLQFGDQYSKGSATLDVRSGGVVDIQTGVAFTGNGDVKNAGTIRVSGGAGSQIRTSAGFENLGGTIDVRKGTLSLTLYGTSTGGTFSVAGGATLYLGGAGGSGKYTGTYNGSGAGTVLLDVAAFENLNADGATFNFPAGMFSWIQGDVYGNWTNAGSLTVSTVNGKSLGGTLVNTGRLVIDQPSAFPIGNPYSTGGIDNRATGTIEVTTNAVQLTATNGSTFKNAGTIQVDAGANFTISLPIANTGSVTLQAGPSTRLALDVPNGTLAGGTYLVGAGATLAPDNANPVVENDAAVVLDGAGASIPLLSSLNANAGSFTLRNGASFTTAGDLANRGTIAVGAGSVLKVSGAYSQTAAGTTSVELAPTAGLVQIVGAATLDGTLAATLAAGFAPTAGQTFRPVTFASHSGSFATFTGPTVDGSPLLHEAVDATGVTLTAVATTPDLAVHGLTATGGPLTIGQPVTVSFTVTDSGAPAPRSWDDSIYLSPDGTIGASAVLLGRVRHTGGLATGASYPVSFTAPLPAVPEDSYHVVVLVDSRDEVIDSNRSNNLSSSPSTLRAVVATLTDGAPVTGTIADGQDLIFRLNATGPQQVTLDGVAGGASLSSRLGAPPSLGLADRTVAGADGSPRRIVFDAGAGVEYLLIHGLPASAAGTPFRLTAQAAPLAVTSVGPAQAAQIGTSTITIHGSGFSPATTVELDGAGLVLHPTSVQFGDSGTLYATFAFNTQHNVGISSPDQIYRVVVSDAGHSTGLDGALTLVDYYTLGPNQDQLPRDYSNSFDVRLTGPEDIRAGKDSTVTIEYTNLLETDIPAPILVLNSSNDLFRLPGQSTFTSGPLLLLALNQDGPAGTLPPRYKGTITLEERAFVDGAHNDSDISVAVLPDQTEPTLKFVPGTTGGSAGPGSGGGGGGEVPVMAVYVPPHPIDFGWDALKAAMKPDDVPQAAWDIIFANFLARVGTRTQDLRQRLEADATYLSGLGQHIADASRLMAFELSAAGDFGAIAERFSTGSLGAGLTSIVDTKATIGTMTESVLTASGPVSRKRQEVTIRDGGSIELFLQQDDGTYAAEGGDTSTLAVVDGAFVLTSDRGQVTRFNADGTVRDFTGPDGSRLVAGYAGGRLTTLTDALGGVTTYVYDANGRITKTTSPQGIVATYAYDPTDTLLTSVTTPAGTTTYTYATSGPALNAVTRVTNPDGTSQSYTYDARGRLASQSGPGGSQPITYAYDDNRPGQVVVTDADGVSKTLARDPSGEVIRTVNANGGVTSILYDNALRPIRITGPDGAPTNLAYDASGRPTEIDDALGGRTVLAYDPVSHALASLRDPDGNITLFSTNAQGQLSGVTYADGSTQSIQYNTAGDPATATDRNGKTTSYSYDASAMLTKATFADNSTSTYTYDAHHNVLTATNANGTTTFTYDAADRPKSITYPSGLSLTYSYDALGRRSSLVDQAGYTVNYSYDSAGRLAGLTDGSGKSLVSYAYDPAGRLARKTFGNGTSTTYTYNAAGLVSEIANRDGSAAISTFDYTYNAVGQPLTVTSADGTTRYAYDALGQLISVALPGGRTITYAYDANGNRVATTDSGTTTSYATNNLNEYTAVGATTYAYDKAGDLTSKTDATGTTTYRYDLQGRLVGVVTPTSGTFAYLYDALGHRIGAVHNGQTTYDLVDPTGFGSVVGRYDSKGNVADRYVYGLDLAGQVDASGVASFYNFDAAGNTTELTGPGGSVLDRYAYLPFGEPLAATGAAPNPFTFSGEAGATTDGTGLVFLGSRSYDPATGRFTQPDPAGLSGGDANLYRYVGNAPTSAIDPSGNDSLSINIFSIDTPIGGFGFGLAVGPDGISGTGSTGRGFGVSGPSVLYSPSDPTYGGGVSTNVSAGIISETGDDLHGTSPYAAFGAGLSVGYSNNATYTTQPFYRFRPEPSILGPKFQQYQDYFKQHKSPYFSDDDVIGRLRLLRDVRKIEAARQRAYELAHPNKFLHKRRHGPHDPNFIAGPTGVGEAGFVAPDQTFPYTIDFENQPTAGASAATVTVVDQLDPSLDWSTFALGAISFGSTTVAVPDGLTSYSTRVDARSTLGVFVDVKAEFDAKTGTARWTLSALDPKTLDTPSDPTLGLLPPDDASGRGSGSVSYSVRPRAGLATGTVIRAAASIVFDVEAPIATPTISNTIDAAAPAAVVTPLATVVGPHLVVSWAGADEPGGSGIASYDLYGSADGGPLAPLLTGTTTTSFAVTASPGHTYGFAVVATDAVGHRQAVPAVAQASTVVVSPSLAVTVTAAPPITAGAAFATGGTFADNLPGPYSATVDYGDGSGARPLALAADRTFALSHPYSSPGTYTVTVTVVDGPGYSAAQSIAVTVNPSTSNPPPSPQPPTLASGPGAAKDAFVITLYRELLGRLPTLSELIAGARKLNTQKSYMGLAQTLFRSQEHKQDQRHHHGTGISLARAYRDASAAAGIGTSHPHGPKAHVARPRTPHHGRPGSR